MGENPTSGVLNHMYKMIYMQDCLFEYVKDWLQPKFPWIRDYLNKSYDNQTITHSGYKKNEYWWYQHSKI